MSDFHKLTTVNLKSELLKILSKQKLYRNYQRIDKNSFENELKSKLDLIKTLKYYSFEHILVNVLNMQVPMKTKIVRANIHEFMTSYKGSSKSNNGKI